MEELHIKLKDIQKRSALKKKLKNLKRPSGKPKKKTGWTEERKEEHRKRMKEI